MAKQEQIVNMFDEIAKSYDITNRILSLNIDTKWRKEACLKALAMAHKDNPNVLDVACGTGDMMLNWIKLIPNLKVLRGIDPSINMLNVAKEKLPEFVELIQGEAKDIDIDDESVDILSIAYGLRNVVELDLALGEFSRVLRNGGILVILEFTKKDNQNIFDKIALFYTSKILPIIGGFISKNYKAYKYLPDSINDFITLEELESRLHNINLKVMLKKRYIGNLCSLIIAKKDSMVNI